MPFTCSRSRQPWLACTSTPTVEPSTTREAVPIPPLKPWHCMPVPLPTPPSAHRAARRRLERGVDVLGPHVHPVDVVQVAVVRLPHHRQVPALLAGRLLLHRRRDQRIADDAHRVGVRQADDGGQEAGLADPLEPGQLAVPVQPVAAGEGGLGPGVVGAGHDDGDAGAHRAASDDQRAVALDQRRVADAHAGDIGDRVGRSRREAADDDPEVARPGAHVRPPSWRGRPSSGIGSQAAAVATW